MGGVVLGIIIQGAFWFIGITLFELIPFLGFFGWLVSIGVWVYLTNKLVTSGSTHLAQSDNPSLPAMGWAALVGFITGLVGAIASLVVQATILANASRGTVTGAGAAFGTLGAIAGLVYWPAMGALVCGIFGLIWGGRAKTKAGPLQD